MMLDAFTGLLTISVSLAPSETPSEDQARGADEDRGLGVVLPDDRDELLGVALDLRPAHAVGLVGDLVQQVGLVAVPLGDLGEEGLGAGEVEVRVAGGEHVPVDDRVHAARGGLFDDRVDHVGELARVGLVAALLDVHGDAQDVGVPVGGQGVERAVGDALAVPLQAVGAHAAQLDGLAVLVAELGAADLELSVDLDGGLAAGGGVGSHAIERVARADRPRATASTVGA
jgi:hypothetical protein